MSGIESLTAVAEELAEMENAIKEWEEENGNNEFTDGVLAVIKYLTQADPEDAPAFIEEYLSER